MVSVAFHGLNCRHTDESGSLGFYSTRRRHLYGSDCQLINTDTPVERLDNKVAAMHVFSFLSDPTVRPSG